MSKLDLARSATSALQQGAKALQGKGVGTTFTKSIGDTVAGIFTGAKTIFGESFVSSGKTILNATSSTPTGKAWLALAGGAIVNGGLIGHNAVSAIEDSRRLTNMSANLSDFYTPYSDAYNVLKFSGTAAAVGLAPAALGGMQLAGESLEKMARAKGSTAFLGTTMKNVGKGGNMAFGSVFGFLGNTVGRLVDGAAKGAGKLVGKNWGNGSAKKILGKHYIWIAGLTAARLAYKTLKIDMIKNPNSGIASLNFGGKSLFIDNDPSSPTFRGSIFLKDAIAKRKKENLERSVFSNMADGITGGTQAAYRLIG